MMMTIDVEANTCLWLAQHGYEPVTIMASSLDFEERYAVDLDSNARMMLEMMQRGATMMNAGQAQGTFMINGQVLPIVAAPDAHYLPIRSSASTW
jgi:hypothetical protein